jgi:hypothetical protein
VGAAGVYALVAVGAARLDVWPFQIAGVLVGAVLFGIGLAVFGYCPGTGLAGSAEGSRDAMTGVLGMLTGAGIFVAGYKWLQPIMLGLGDLGKMTIPGLLGVSSWIVIGTMAALMAAVLATIEYRERRKTPDRSTQDPVGKSTLQSFHLARSWKAALLYHNQFSLRSDFSSFALRSMPHR